MERISILLVDDNATFLRVAHRFLQQYPEVARVESVPGGNDALTKAEELRPDVVLVDLAMPGMSGLQAIARLRATMPEIAIIALTMMSRDGYRQAALAAGADEFVAKATMDADLLPAIQQVLQTRWSERGSTEKSSN